MKRLYGLIVLAVVLVAVGFVLTGHPGQVSLDWFGWRVDTSAALVLVLGALAVLAVSALVGGGRWLAGAPARSARARIEGRRIKAHALLTQSALALDAGDGPEALRLARRAQDLDAGSPTLAGLLAAHAAEAAHDDAAAQSAYAALLDTSDGQAAGRRGLERLEARRAATAVAPPATPA